MLANSDFKTGIYAIRNVDSGKVYIGSAVNFDARWRIHLHHLRKHTHHCSRLQNAWDKYGSEAFVFEKLLVCSSENLIAYEQALIDIYKASDREFGFNSAHKAGSMLGYKHTAETKEKIKEKRATQVFSEETRAIWSKNRTGRKMPEWFGEFTRQHKTGTKHSEVTRATISAKGIGRPVSLVSRQKKSKITFDQVAAIKTRFESGETQTQIATEFSLSQSAVSLIVSGKRWANLPLPNQSGATK